MDTDTASFTSQTNKSRINALDYILLNRFATVAFENSEKYLPLVFRLVGLAQQDIDDFSILEV